MKEIAGLLNRYSCMLDWVQLDLTNRCNLRCIHCYKADRSPRNELSLSEIKDIFNQLTNIGCFKITITGGEPFLRKDFSRILEYSFRQEFALVLLTNGTLLTRKLVDMLRHQPVSLQLSLYGPNPEVHEKITRIKGSFAKTMNGIYLLKKAGIKFWVTCMVMQHNWEVLKDIVDLAKREEFKVRFDFLIFNYRFNKKKSSPTRYRLSDRQLRKIFSLDYFRNYLLRRTPFEKEDRKRFIKSKIDTDLNYCFINPRGKVHTSLFSDTEVGDLRIRTFNTIWENKILYLQKRFRIENFECYSCQYLNLCSPCFGEAYLEHKDIFKKPDECCRITRNFVKAQLERRR